MARKKLPADITDVQEIMRSICDKWALLILHQLSLGTKRHNELRRGIARYLAQDADADAPQPRAGSISPANGVSGRAAPGRLCPDPVRGDAHEPVARPLSMDRKAHAGDSARSTCDEAADSPRQANAAWRRLVRPRDADIRRLLEAALRHGRSPVSPAPSRVVAVPAGSRRDRRGSALQDDGRTPELARLYLPPTCRVVSRAIGSNGRGRRGERGLKPVMGWEVGTHSRRYRSVQGGPLSD